jgi:hypothetical protein
MLMAKHKAEDHAQPEGSQRQSAPPPSNAPLAATQEFRNLRELRAR